MGVKLLSPSVVLLAFLIPTSSQAEPQPEAPVRAPRATVVAIMSGAGQALVYDRDQDEYVVVRKGDRIQGFTISSIDPDQVVLRGTEKGRFFVLTLPHDDPAVGPKNTRNAGRAVGASKPKAVSERVRLAILDPYGLAPLDNPYTGPFNEVSAAGTPASTKAPGLTPPALTPRKSPLLSTKPALAAATNAKSAKAAAKPAPLIEKRKISRKELDAALSDFYSLGKEVKLEMTVSGVRIAAVSRGSFFDRMGLDSGDVVDKIGGKRIRNADDAALIYVELTSAKSFTVELDRRGVPVTLKFTVTR